MKRISFLAFLAAVNLALTGLLVFELKERSSAKNVPPLLKTKARPLDLAEGAQTAINGNISKQDASASGDSVQVSPFTRMYSEDPMEFAANLRDIGCPEETVKDILTAEISRRYREQEETLRPRPADHVPITWSANPSERKLFQRRQQAAAIARDKAAALRHALGYEVPVATPIYATSTSEQRFEDSLAALPADRRRVVASAHEEYWAGVRALSERTRGFWQAEDVAQLEQLKAERRTLIENLSRNP